MRLQGPGDTKVGKGRSRQLGSSLLKMNGVAWVPLTDFVAVLHTTSDVLCKQHAWPWPIIGPAPARRART